MEQELELVYEKRDTDLLKMFNKAIDEARADGTLAEHFTKWFGKDISM